MTTQNGRLVSVYLKDNSLDLNYGDRFERTGSGRNAVPTISVVATIPTATEAGPTAGLFTLQRKGDSSTAFNVLISLTGTALAGLNYVSVPLLVPFAVGQVLAQVAITPIPGGLGAATSATCVLTAVSDTSSNYYADMTITPNGPLSSTDVTTVLNNQATIIISH